MVSGILLGPNDTWESKLLENFEQYSGFDLWLMVGVFIFIAIEAVHLHEKYKMDWTASTTSALLSFFIYLLFLIGLFNIGGLWLYCILAAGGVLWLKYRSFKTAGPLRKFWKTLLLPCGGLGVIFVYLSFANAETSGHCGQIPSYTSHLIYMLDDALGAAHKAY